MPPLKTIPVVPKIFWRVHVDIFGPLPISRNGNKYVALMDTQAFQDEFRPRYRCAMYQEDEYTGAIKFALSSDSTCTNQLRSPTEGYEVLHMRPKIQQKAWPALIGNVQFYFI